MSTAEVQLIFSPRERRPQIVPVARQLARELTVAGRGADAGWLLLALVAAELIRPDRVSGPARALAQDAAEALAQAGATVAAGEIYLALGDQARAAAMLRRSGRLDVAETLDELDEDPKLLVQRGLGDGPCIASTRHVRKQARSAFGNGSVTQANADKVLPLLQALGLHKTAAQLASRLGAHAMAGESWTEAGDLIAAARCFHAANDSERALQVLMDASPEDPAYRQACIFAVRLAERLDCLEFRLYHLVGSFVAAGPADDTERATFGTLAELFDRMGQPQAADEVRAVLGGRPTTASTAPIVDLSELPSLPPSPLDVTVEVDNPIVPPQGNLHPGARPQTGRNSTPDGDSRGGDRRVNSQRRSSDPNRTLSADSTPDRDQVLRRVGTVIGGRYYIDSPLRGATPGLCFKARDLSISEEVALEFLPGIGGDRQALNRFRQEMSLARSLAHPNIARIVGMGDEEGTPFVCTELLHGVSLDRLTRNELPLARAIDVIRQAAEGLSVAHAMDVVHRDITLTKLFLTQSGTLKVLGFGLAGAAATHDVTVSGYLAGTPVYMAPEQIDDFQAATAAADQYALAVVTYHLLTGRPPFSHPELVPLLRMHAETKPAPPSSVEPTVSRGLDKVVLRALAKAPADRFPTCRAFASALLEAAANPGAQA